MNTYQRIVLIIGAIALIVAIWTCPKFVIFEGKYFEAGSQFWDGYNYITVTSILRQ